MDEPLTAPKALAASGFAEHRKKTLTRISDITFPPGTVYQTPEGLRAEDEETRCAFDVQGGIYPIRESVFQASYEPARLQGDPGLLREAATELADFIVYGIGWIERGPSGMSIADADRLGALGDRLLSVLAASPPEPEPLDVERLRQAIIDEDHAYPGRGWVEAVVARYARLSEPAQPETPK